MKFALHDTHNELSGRWRCSHGASSTALLRHSNKLQLHHLRISKSIRFPTRMLKAKSKKKSGMKSSIVIKMVLVLIYQRGPFDCHFLPALETWFVKIEKGIHHLSFVESSKVARSLFNCDLSFARFSRIEWLTMKNKFAAITSQPFNFIVHLVCFLWAGGFNI